MANRKSAAEIGANYLPAPEAAIEMGLDGARLTVTKASELKNEIMTILWNFDGIQSKTIRW